LVSGEIKKKLVFEVNQLKANLISNQAELEEERHGCHVSKEALRAQVVESEKRRDDSLATLTKVSNKSDAFKRDCEGT
jgi:hypothetical protein